MSTEVLQIAPFDLYWLYPVHLASCALNHHLQLQL